MTNRRNIVIPMSGRGQRFKEAGYQVPKPLITVDNKPMIQSVVESVGVEGRYIFLVLRDHCQAFGLPDLLPTFCGTNPCEIIQVDQVTEGAACTCLLAKDQIDNDDELLIANSDQLVEWDSAAFFSRASQLDGGILTFTGHEPKWSFVKVAPGTDLITEVAEKKPISDKATVGIYWLKRGRDFVRAAEQMIAKNLRVNNEFYVCPIFNELIAEGKQICAFPVAGMQGLGTPEDLNRYQGIQE